MPFFPKAVIFLIIAGTMTYFLGLEDERGGFEEWDRNYRSFLQANTQEKILEPSVTYLQIDDPEKRVFGSWPLGPVDYSILIDNLAKNNPKLVAVEPVLGWRGTAEDVLVRSVRSVLLRLDPDQVLLGAELMENPAGVPIKASTLSLFPQLKNVSGDRSEVPEFTQTGLMPEASLMALGPVVGFTRIDLGDSEAKQQRDSFTVPLLARHGDSVVPSFILVAIVKEAGADMDAVEVSLDERLIRVKSKDPIEIPVDEGGRLTVHTGIRDAIARHNADILVLDGQEDIRDQLSPEEKKSLLSRIVILGTDDEVARTIQLPKSEEKISQAELFAMAMATIQAKRFIQKVSPLVEFGIWAGLAILGLVILRSATKGRVLMLWVVLVIFYIFGGIAFFQYTGQWVPIVVPAGIIGAILLVGLLLPPAAVVEEPAQENAPG